jgi:flagellar motor switch protein FliN/FliY
VPGSVKPLDWIGRELSRALSAAIAAMSGSTPEVRYSASQAPATPGLVWEQSFRGATGRVWISSAEPAWQVLGRRMAAAAGLDENDLESVKSTFLETLGQALAAFAQALSAKLRREVTLEAGRESQDLGPAGAWLALEVDPGIAPVAAGFEAALLAALESNEESPRKAGENDEAGQSHEAAGFGRLDLLLDVELPVGVSFGRAQMQLKDLLKLTTGSIVELNRSVSEPVEILVNNCVIARGEVVVVEGNFGVRIQQIVNRQERLRTLH